MNQESMRDGTWSSEKTDYSLITQCRGCHAPEGNLRTVLEMEPMPLAGMFCETGEEALEAPVFPLTWAHCSHCGLVQVRENISDAFLFSKYNYASSTVPGLVRHFDSYAAFLSDRYGRDAKVRFLEIGCNDGVLLNRLPRKWQRIGWDPSDVARRDAENNSNYQLYPLPFSEATAQASGLEASVDVVSGSNCLAHISDLRDVFQGVRHVLRPGGHLWIEVHDLQALLQGGQWDTIYHEHKVEWSEQALTRCLAPLGLVLRETFRTPMHGGALRICFQKTRVALKTSCGTVPPDPGLAELQRAYEQRYESATARKLLAAADAGKKIAAYGAAGRANVYLNQMSRLPFEYVVDEAPLRMNKFLPRIGTPIVPPSRLQEEPVEACLVTAWNYRDDIVRKNSDFRGKWLTAFGE
ncbi:MAG TPA: methyltransferase domain-containing protein [Thermoguttaceae bacterium]|nr:methyltransferase domain-containing protein [Thermoguttaceae bacterium]